MELVLGVDVACKAPHVASLARMDGVIVWTGRKFRSRPEELDRLWADLDLGEDSLRVVMEPTGNAWKVLAGWFGRHGASVSVVPTTQAADLRAYLAKHTKNDRLDSQMLALLPRLHPEGLRAYDTDAPVDPLRRAVRLRASIVLRRTAIFQRLDAQLELLGPAWQSVLDPAAGKAALAVLARYPNPEALVGLGQTRLAAFVDKHSRGHWGVEHAARLLAAARESLALWAGGLDFAALAADIMVEAEQAQHLSRQIDGLDARIASLAAQADPAGIVASAPGVGAVTSGIIIGRLGDPHRFDTLAAVRSYAGLVPSVAESGLWAGQSRLTKAGDPLLRAALFQAADTARKIDPQLAARYVRLMSQGHHHDSATCHVATALLTRVVACWRRGEPYRLRDTDGQPLTTAQGRQIVTDHHQVPPPVRAAARHRRAAQHLKHRAGREPQESLSAPTSRPAKPTLRAPQTA